MTAGQGSGPGVDPARLIVELAALPGVADRLLLQHRADAAGRCVACTRGGTGQPWIKWPCVLHFYAAAAQRLAAGRAVGEEGQ